MKIIDNNQNLLLYTQANYQINNDQLITRFANAHIGRVGKDVINRQCQAVVNFCNCQRKPINDVITADIPD